MQSADLSVLCCIVRCKTWTVHWLFTHNLLCHSTNIPNSGRRRRLILLAELLCLESLKLGPVNVINILRHPTFALGLILNSHAKDFGNLSPQ